MACYRFRDSLYILAFHLTKSRSEDSAFTLINEAKKFGEPSNFVTDRLPSYNQTVAKVLPNTKHIPVAPMSSDTATISQSHSTKHLKLGIKQRKALIHLKKRTI